MSEDIYPVSLTIIIDMAVEPDGDGFHAWCPLLKGLHTQGDSIGQAIHRSKDAVIGYLESLIKHGHPIPKDAIRFPEELGD